MGPGLLTRYNASAGSGKTYKLTSIYLEKLLESPGSFRKILAVTFTNKASSEMKRKILDQLSSIAEGRNPELISSLSAKSGKKTEKVIAAAKDLLFNILHDYSYFNVGTIDSFFQKVLKSLTREIGLQHGYIIEMDHTGILEKAVEEMLSSAKDDSSLKEWIIDYSRERAEGGKGWNLRSDISDLAEEIFREKFRLIPKSERDLLKDRKFLSSYAGKLRKHRKEFNDRLTGYAEKLTGILDNHAVTSDMFLRGDRGGVPSFIKTISEVNNGVWKPPTATVLQTLEDPPVWTSKSGRSRQLESSLSDGFGDTFREALEYFLQNYADANTALFISDNIYILGILSNILEQVHIITTAENRFLLSDSAELLWLILKDDQTPFIYEKTGNRFENFMIDEFQDTSLIQWNNFRPLIENSMAEGHDNLVVGDVKQSIYRWRNSDWKILRNLEASGIRKDGLKDEYLGTNWRSSRNIIAFNNSLFRALPEVADNNGEAVNELLKISNLYADAFQETSGKKEGGFVRLSFLDDENLSFTEKVCSLLPALIEEIQDKGYSGSDIGILVRTNREGAMVMETMLEYRSRAGKEKNEKYNYNIISSDSLLLSSAPVICFLVEMLRFPFLKDKNLCTAIMLRNWTLISGKDPFSISYNNIMATADELFPAGYNDFIESLKGKSPFEAIESAVRFFKLGEDPGNSTWLNTLQDYVIEISGNVSPDIQSFLEWWDNTGIKKSVVVSDQSDSMRVMTIHKSKGLEFKAVIIPFISWSTGHGSGGPVLWISQPDGPFSELGIVPVRYKSDLKYSRFHKEYLEESYHALIDNINLLYVAFTRPIDLLYGFCPKKSRTGNISKLLLDSILCESTDANGRKLIPLKEYYNSANATFSFGEILNNGDQEHTGDNTKIKSSGYLVNNGISGLRFRLHSENWLTDESGKRQKKINYGLLMHEILESVITPSDTEAILDRIETDGRINADERKELGNRFRELFNDSQVSSWFVNGLNILNEPQIVTAGGNIKRPDRVIIGEKIVTVIDFKFGAEKEWHRRQVKEYMRLIGDIESKKTEGFLWYVDNKKVVAVE